MGACYRCGEKIKFIDELSIDHKKNWLYEDVSLFWDLNNITFSHLKCNTSARRHNNIQKIVVPEGTAWCSNCHKSLPVSNFGKKKKTKGSNRKYRAYCNPCRKVMGWQKG